jgi:hypothetical protein
MVLVDKVNAGGPLRDASIDLARARVLTEQFSVPVTCTPATVADTVAYVTNEAIGPPITAVGGDPTEPIDPVGPITMGS